MTAGGLSGALNITVGAVGATVIGGSGNDVITGAGAADKLVGGSGDDTINGGAFADSISGGTGNDRFVLGNGVTIDSITDFSTSGANGADVIAFSFTALYNGTLTALKDGNDAAVVAGTVAGVKHVSTATTLAAGQNVIVLDGTFGSSAAVLTAIDVGGSRQLTLASAAGAATDDIMVVWTDGTTGHVGTVNWGAAATTAAAAYTADLATLTGVADVTGLASANFLWIV